MASFVKNSFLKKNHQDTQMYSVMKSKNMPTSNQLIGCLFQCGCKDIFKKY